MPPNLRLRPRVVVIGCGFAGLAAVRRLSGEAVDIVLIDRSNHHLFQPLLYQVATAGLAAPSIAEPIRHLLRPETARGNLTILLGEVTGIDAGARLLKLDGREQLPYDYLIVASGASHSYFGNEHWAPHAPGLKTLSDAFELRARILLAFERAERAPLAERAAQLSFVVIGAGPTGVEMAGTMIEIARRTLRHEYRRIDPRSAQVLLLEGNERVLPAFSPQASARALEQLQRLGVDVRLGCRVTDIGPQGLRYTAADGTTRSLATRTVVWAAGVAASPLGAMLVDAEGRDRAGRVIVAPDLSLPGRGEIFVAGDLAAARCHRDPVAPRPVPGLSPAAKQMGRLAAANVLRRLQGRATRAFRYRDHGVLATIGRRAAVAELSLPLLGRCRLSGYPAWLFWLFVHIFFLIGFRNRVVVFADWMMAYWTARRSARVIATPAPDSGLTPMAGLRSSASNGGFIHHSPRRPL